MEHSVPSVYPGTPIPAGFPGSATEAWPFAGAMTSSDERGVVPASSENSAPHSEHLQCSIIPTSVQVDSTDTTFTIVWPVTGMVVCAIRISPQTEQTEASVRPGPVQVAGFPLIVEGVCPSGSMDGG